MPTGWTEKFCAPYSAIAKRLRTSPQVVKYRAERRYERGLRLGWTRYKNAHYTRWTQKWD